VFRHPAASRSSFIRGLRRGCFYGNDFLCCCSISVDEFQDKTGLGALNGAGDTFFNRSGLIRSAAGGDRQGRGNIARPFFYEVSLVRIEIFVCNVENINRCVRPFPLPGFDRLQLIDVRFFLSSAFVLAQTS